MKNLKTLREEYEEFKALRKEDEQLARIYQYPAAVQWVENPTENFLLKVVSRNHWTIRYISDSTPTVQFAALRMDPCVITAISNPCRKAQYYAVWRHSHLVRRIEKPSIVLRIFAIIVKKILKR